MIFSPFKIKVVLLMFKYLACLMHPRKYERLFYLLIIQPLIFQANPLTTADHSVDHPMHTNTKLSCVLLLVFKYVYNILECWG